MERKPHWLRQNSAARLPRRVVCFDCESYQERNRNGSEHSFRLGCASFDRLDALWCPTGTTELQGWEDAREFWQWITSCTSHSHRTVAFAHNLSFDLRVSQALVHLPALGFRCKGIALTNYSCWARFHDGRRSLWLVDSLSYIPASLERIANALGAHKLPLPEDDATQEEWFQRCRSDVDVTRQAVLRLLEFLRTEDCGDFRTTGSGQGFAVFRHRFLRPKTLLVHNDLPALEAERRAVWTGRAEVWKWGEVKEPVHEFDFASAYAHLARDLSVPVQLRSAHGPISFDRLRTVADEYAVVADVEVETEVPTVPTNHDDHILWPIGRFQTTLWDQELELAHEHGAKINVLRYWYYKRAPILREWADWILDLLDGNGAGNDPMLRFVIKDWSRSLIGRFGLRYADYENIANTESSDVRLFGCYDSDEKKSLTYLQLGQEWFEQMQLVESPNSTPCVMGYIMSAARVQLWKAMSNVGFGNVLYCDTDGILVKQGTDTGVRSNVANGTVPPLRHKATYASAILRAPRNLDLGSTRRVNGAPRQAERLSHSVYRGEVWESLPTALRRQRSDRVIVHDRTFNISDDDPRREHLEDGSTAAIRIG